MKIVSKKSVGKKHVYDITVADNHNFIANGIVAHNSGARKFCQAVQPTCVEDLAAITAIYRPGPLKANVHNLFVEARKKEHIDYAHPVIEEILGPTKNFVVYQEQFMLLAEKLGGFTPGEADQLRKTLVKKSLDTIGKKASEKDVAKKKFIDGALKLHGLGKEVTEPLWQTIDNMSVYCLGGETEVVTPAGKKFIKDAQPNDWVLSRTGFVRVVRRFDQGVKKVYKIRTSSGKVLRCTLDHEIMTDEGMMKLEDILKNKKKIEVIGSSFEDVTETEFCGEEEVYDIEVDHPDHMFYGNDVLVSNCFNKSHSLAYSIDSYYSAWLHTHHEKEWLATILQSENDSPAGLTKTIAEIKALGYKFSKVDVNYSGSEWTYSEEAGAFVPPLGSVKGIGSAAVEEIVLERPFKDVKSMLYTDDGVWRFSRVNKTVLTALCSVEGFESLEDFQNGNIANHKQLLLALTDGDNYESLRKGIYGMSPTQLKKAAKANVPVIPMIDFLLDSLRDTPDWDREEKIATSFDMVSTVDSDLLFPPSVVEMITNKDVPRLYDIPPGTEGIGWFCAADVEEKVTKNKKKFYRIKAIDDQFRTTYVRVWGTPKEPITRYTLWVTKVQNDPQWGFSTSVFKMRQMV